MENKSIKFREFFADNYLKHYERSWSNYNLVLHQNPDNIIILMIMNIGELLSEYIESRSTILSENDLGILEAYYKVLDDMKILADKLEIHDPIQAYGMFMFALCNGSLSLDKKFQYKDTTEKDFYYSLGVKILGGYGVCRHIATAFKDFLCTLNIDASAIPVLTKKPVYSLKETNKPVNKEEFIKKIYHEIPNDKKRDDILKLINDNYQGLDDINVRLVTKYINDHRSSLLKSNHVITIASQDGINYYFDPTNNNILKRIEGKNTFIDLNGRLYLYDRFHTKGYYDHSYFNPNKLDLDKITCNQDSKRLKNVIDYNDSFNMCVKYKLLFDEFYKEHADLYKDVSDRLIRSRKK